ncbi:hypothetical protein EMPG_12734 [Blastomyces silverae]|uniref:Uncharacterized protein n=1 Tax=Blastomyces silverae TaxID=2060906 RepID=A0A0H1BLJ5_9EURO|nr:hypothetical protein EMPG_12734 [Blastomyces silverae]
MDLQNPNSYIALGPLDRREVARESYGEGSRASPDDGSSSKPSLDGATIIPDNNGQSSTNKRLRRRPTVLYLVAFYVTVSVYSWVVMCMLSRQQVNTKLGITGTRLYKAAKFLSGAAGILAFPVATAVCARAVVPYVQTERNGLTLRQTMFLADRSWTSPHRWAGKSMPKRQNLFLWLAFWIHLIGFAVFPLQQILIGEVTVKHHGNIERGTSMIDFSSLLQQYGPTQGNILVQNLRYAITSVFLDNLDPHIWINTTDCTDDANRSALRCKNKRPYSPIGSQSLGELDPGKSFISPALTTFNTGLLRQFAPRLNSTISYDIVPMDDFPADCANLPGSFYAAYSGMIDGNPHYSIEACMPANQTNSPWKDQFRTPQTISEALYLKIFIGDFGLNFPGFSGGPTVFKVEADSTSGYFELPNYLNNNTAGDLLPRDPAEFCDEHCTDQGYMPAIITNDRDMRSASRKSKRWFTNFTTPPEPDSKEVEFKFDMKYENSDDIDHRANPGPLYTVAEALFGNSSFIAARSHSPLAYTGTDRFGPCRDLAPLVSLMKEGRGRYNYDIRQAQLDCLRRPDDTQVTWQVANWLGLFWTNDSSLASVELDEPETFQMKRTLTAAVYLAHKGWLLGGDGSDRNFEIRSDMGNDAPMPVISSAGVIAISMLLGIFLLSLIAVAGYTYSVPTFTSTLDAFVMLRLGAQLTTDDNTDPLPALSANSSGVTALDRKHGWFGDGKPDEDVGRVELGADARLRNGREYLAS